MERFGLLSVVDIVGWVSGTVTEKLGHIDHLSCCTDDGEGECEDCENFHVLDIVDINFTNITDKEGRSLPAEHHSNCCIIAALAKAAGARPGESFFKKLQPALTGTLPPCILLSFRAKLQILGYHLLQPNRCLKTLVCLYSSQEGVLSLMVHLEFLENFEEGLLSERFLNKKIITCSWLIQKLIRTSSSIDIVEGRILLLSLSRTIFSTASSSEPLG